VIKTAGNTIKLNGSRQRRVARSLLAASTMAAVSLTFGLAATAVETRVELGNAESAIARSFC
jgi:hypothetical protein